MAHVKEVGAAFRIAVHSPRQRSGGAVELRPPRSKGHIPPADHPWRRMVDENRRRRDLKARGVTFSLSG